MDKKYLEEVFNDAMYEVNKHSMYRLNFGVYYTPRS